MHGAHERMNDGFLVFVSDVAKQIVKKTGLLLGERDFGCGAERCQRPYEFENFV
jgi:hypothetical protein